MKLSAAEAAVARLLAPPRRVRLEDGRILRLGGADTAIPDALSIALQCGAGPARLVAPTGAVEHCLATLDPAAASARAAWRDLLLELAFREPLARLAAHNPALHFKTASAAAFAVAHTLHLELDDVALRLECSAGVAAALADLVPALAHERTPWPDLPVPLAVMALASSVTLNEWRRAVPGSVVLARPVAPGGMVGLVAGGRFLWHATRDGRRLRVESGRQVPSEREWRDVFMEDEAAAADVPLGELPVRLGFELGRLDVTVAEIETLAPGHVFELARLPDEAVDIVASGRRVGAGRIVLVGDQVGVQITRIGPR